LPTAAADWSDNRSGSGFHGGNRPQAFQQFARNYDLALGRELVGSQIGINQQYSFALKAHILSK